MRVYTKEEIALAQLETALDLHERGTEPLAVITLAGTAEEILGKLVAQAGGEPALMSNSEAAQRIMQFLDLEVSAGTDAKSFADRANRARNALKHLNAGGDPIELDPGEEAPDMLDRAITNYWRLRADLTPRMRSFVDAQVGKTG